MRVSSSPDGYLTPPIYRKAHSFATQTNRRDMRAPARVRGWRMCHPACGTRALDKIIRMQSRHVKHSTVAPTPALRDHCHEDPAHGGVWSEDGHHAERNCLRTQRLWLGYPREVPQPLVWAGALANPAIDSVFTTRFTCVYSMNNREQPLEGSYAHALQI